MRGHRAIRCREGRGLRTHPIGMGRAIGAHPGVAHPLGEGRNRGRPRGLATARAAWLYEIGQPAGEASTIAKYAAAEAAINAVDTAIQTHGGNGLLPQWGVARLLRIAPVSREMILNYLAQHSLALPKSYRTLQGRKHTLPDYRRARPLHVRP